MKKRRKAGKGHAPPPREAEALEEQAALQAIYDRDYKLAEDGSGFSIVVRARGDENEAVGESTSPAVVVVRQSRHDGGDSALTDSLTLAVTSLSLVSALRRLSTVLVTHEGRLTCAWSPWPVDSVTHWLWNCTAR
jgi:hypothetical protein